MKHQEATGQLCTVGPNWDANNDKAYEQTAHTPNRSHRVSGWVFVCVYITSGSTTLVSYLCPVTSANTKSLCDPELCRPSRVDFSHLLCTRHFTTRVPSRSQLSTPKSETNSCTTCLNDIRTPYFRNGCTCELTLGNCVNITSEVRWVSTFNHLAVYVESIIYTFSALADDVDRVP